MKSPENEIFSLSIVLIGEFNPRIFQPHWMVSKNLIRESEGRTDNLKLIHPDLMIFETDEFRMEVRPNRFELATLQESFQEPLKDLCASIFKLIAETQISAYGINYTKHFRMENEKKYVEFGYHLAPLKKNFSFIEDPRLLEIIVTDRKNEKTDSSISNVKIYPSDLIAQLGIGININSHFDIKFNGINFSKHLIQNWNSTLLKSEIYIQEIWKSY